jgi:hypothetical protein
MQVQQPIAFSSILEEQQQECLNVLVNNALPLSKLHNNVEFNNK